MLSLSGLGFDYPNLSLFQQIHFTLEQGDLLHLRGENGSGKSTLLRLIAGLMEPLEGNIHYNNQSIYKNLSLYQKNVCYLGHLPGMHPLLTVEESCHFNPWGNLPPAGRVQLLKKLKLEKAASRPVYQLSAGQRHRLALLRFFITGAPLWLVDEPLVSLDEESIETVTDCFNAHLEKGGLILLTSHQALPDRLKVSKTFSLSDKTEIPV